MRIVDCNLANILQRAPLVLFAGAGFYCALFFSKLALQLVSRICFIVRGKEISIQHNV